MENEFEQEQQGIVVPVQKVNSALAQGVKSATKDLVTRELSYFPRGEYQSPEVRQISDYGIIEKESETSTQRNWKNATVVLSALGVWYTTSGIIKVSVLSTASLGAGFVLPALAVGCCGAKSVAHFLNSEYSESIGYSLYGGIIIVSTASTITPIWRSQRTTESDLTKYRTEKNQYQQYHEGYKPPFSFDGFAPALIITVIAAIGLRILTSRYGKD